MSGLAECKDNQPGFALDSLKPTVQSSLREWRRKPEYLTTLTQGHLFRATGFTKEAALSVIDFFHPH